MSHDLSFFTINKPLWLHVQHPLLQKHHPELWLCQLQTQPTQLAGNKWLKLKYHIARVISENKQGIVTFGGAFSNHIAAVAVACQQLGLSSLTYLRADSLDLSNPTIKLCVSLGMQFTLLNRSDYRLRSDHNFCQMIAQRHPQLLLVPEGGSSDEGVKGIAELNLTDTPAGKADLISLATASGGTIAGVISANTCDVLGIATVKDPTIPKRIEQLLPQQPLASNWTINMDYTAAGYAKFNPELLAFCLDMSKYRIQVEPIYSGKALYGLFNLIGQGKLNNYKRISFFHTGGMQGLDGLLYRKLISAKEHQQLTGVR